MYEKEGIDDDEDQEEMSMEARLAAEQEMRKRDQMLGISQGRMRHGLLYGEFIGIFPYHILVCLPDESEEDEVAPPLSKRQRIAERAAEGREPIEEVGCISSSML